MEGQRHGAVPVVLAAIGALLFVGMVVFGILALLDLGDDAGAPRREALSSGVDIPLEAPTFDDRTILVGERCLKVQVADTENERAYGLKNRDSLGDYQGMEFVYERDTSAGFTMSETRIPLTIGFYASDGTRVDAVDMEPCPSGQNCPIYHSRFPYRDALEVPKGELPDGPLGGTCPAPS